MRTRETLRGFQGRFFERKRDDRRKDPLFLPVPFLPAAWNVDAVTGAAAHILTHPGWKPNAEMAGKRDTDWAPRGRGATTPACSGLLTSRENLYAFKPLFLEFSVGCNIRSN